MATLFIGQNTIFLPEVDSTNSYASSLLKNVNTLEGTVVYTSNQTQGKGQRGNSWKAEPAMNVTLSVILKPNFLNAKKSFYLSKITALALHDVLAELLEQSQFDIKIKWPNDILVNGKKIAGILIENAFKETNIVNSIVGIGLNVNQTAFADLTESATSMNSLTKKEYDLEKVMQLIFEKLEKWYLILRSAKFETIDRSYLQLLYKLNETCVFSKDQKEFNAKIIGVNEDGLLLLELEDKTQRSFEMKEVKMVI